MKIFKNLGKIDYLKKIKKVELNLDSIKKGLNLTEEFIIYKDKDISIYDRICDHNSGKLISKNNKTFCPMHKWEFIPETGKYTNGLVKKKKDYEIINNKILVDEKIFEPKIKSSKKESKIKVRYINHAFLIIETKDYKFATDPWALGPAFNTGWWLKHKTIANWKEELNSCDFIYVSHNHPDHCHELTLSYVKKDIDIIIPNFQSNSVGILLEDFGFTNIHKLNFENQYQFKDTNLILSIFKSGDLREDSGLFFSIGSFKILLTVDSNNLNFLRLPKVDLFASSFAGGAHGYPLNCENYSLDDRIKMLTTDKNFIKNTKIKYLKNINPKFFLPYAGFFEERLKRDELYIKYNVKNEVKDYEKICKKLKIKILDVNKETIFEFYKTKLKRKKYKGKYFLDLNEDRYLQNYKILYNKIDTEFIRNYFINSNFHDGTKLYINLTDDKFENEKYSFLVNFGNKINFTKLSLEQLKKKLFIDNNYLYLKIRKESFLNTLYNKRSWEDISIGFQNKQYRKPNHYNSNFWFHFSNIYVSSKFVKSLTECSNCTILNQNLHKLLSKENVSVKNI